MKPEDLLLNLKQMTRNHPEGIPMCQFKSIVCRGIFMSQKNWSGMIRFLVSQRKVEVSDADMKIRPILDEMDRTINKEVQVTENLIKDILIEKGPCTPNEAYKHCVMKFGYCNPETFTRFMRLMAENGQVMRDESGYYSLGKPREKPIFTYARGLI